MRGAHRGRIVPGRAALALALALCALPAPAHALDSVPLPRLLPAPEPNDLRRVWFGLRGHLDWERFEITLSDASRYARHRPMDHYVLEAGLALGRRLSGSLELSTVGFGATVQVDLAESGRAKLAAVAHASALRSFGAGMGLAASAGAALGRLRLVPFGVVDLQISEVFLERGDDDRSPYNSVGRTETAIVPTAGVALVAGSFEVALAAGWRAIVGSGAFEAQRQADPVRRGGASAALSVRFVPRRFAERG